LPLIRKEIESPRLYGSERPDIVLAGWGSSYGLMKEAVDSLAQNHNIAMLHFSEIYPLPSTAKLNYMDVLKNASFTLCFENNATGQFARLIKSETGYDFNRLLNRFDGRPFILEELIGEINGFLGRL
jgi:2-oxoglutarate ferredoxin oxidoreductase subunit alpha